MTARNNMPELPEVRTVAKILSPLLEGKKIIHVEIIREKNILAKKEDFCQFLENETFLDVSNYGKYLIFSLTNEKILLSHLRMEGRYRIRKEGSLKGKYDICLFHLHTGEILVYEDVRKFGTLEIKEKKNLFLTPPLSKLGKQPWEENPDHFYSLIHHKRKPIKEVLMDQSVIAGIGNIYADETLFKSKIHPLTPACSLTKEETTTLLLSSQEILEDAIMQGGTTIRSYHPKEGIDGLFAQKLKVYGKGNTPCPCCLFPLKKIEVGGRGTTFCPCCQKRKDHPLVLGITGTIASGKSTLLTLLKKHGYHVYSADEIVHEAYKSEEMKQFFSSFYPLMIKKNTVNRAILLDYMQKDSLFRKKVEEKVHPFVYQKMQEIINEAKKNDKLAIEVPLLFSSPLEKECDLIIFVYASKEKQRERLIKRGKDPDKSLLFAPHFSLDEVKRKCGLLINGDDSLEDFKEKVNRISYLFD